MAVNTAAARLTVSAINQFEKEVYDSISDYFQEVEYLRSNGRIKFNSAGPSIEWPLQTNRGAVAAFNREARTDYTPVNPGVRLTLSNKGYKTADLVHMTDIWECAGPQQIIDIMENRTQWQPESIQRALATEMFIGDGSTDNGYGTNGIIGFDNSILTTGTYAGQNVATETAVKGQVLSGAPYNAFSTDPLNALSQGILACERGTQAGGANMYPDAIWLNYTNYAQLLNSIEAKRRVVDDGDSEKTGKRGTLKHMGVTIYRSRFVPASKGYITNSKFLDVRCPTPKLLMPFKQEIGSPWSIGLMTIFYGLFRNIVPRAHARMALA